MQGGLCGNSHCNNKGKFHMDHNHISMRFRGLLCGPCNRALGMCQDNFRVLLGLAYYVKAAEEMNEKATV